MDNVSLFRAIEGKDAAIFVESEICSGSYEATCIHISIDGEIMWGNNIISVDWDKDPDIIEVEPGTYKIVASKQEISIVVSNG